MAPSEGQIRLDLQLECTHTCVRFHLSTLSTKLDKNVQGPFDAAGLQLSQFGTSTFNQFILLVQFNDSITFICRAVQLLPDLKLI